MEISQHVQPANIHSHISTSGFPYMKGARLTHIHHPRQSIGIRRLPSSSSRPRRHEHMACHTPPWNCRPRRLLSKKLHTSHFWRQANIVGTMEIDLWNSKIHTRYQAKGPMKTIPFQPWFQRHIELAQSWGCWRGKSSLVAFKCMCAPAKCKLQSQACLLHNRVSFLPSGNHTTSSFLQKTKAFLHQTSAGQKSARLCHTVDPSKKKVESILWGRVRSLNMTFN